MQTYSNLMCVKGSALFDFYLTRPGLNLLDCHGGMPFCLDRLELDTVRMVCVVHRCHL